MRLMALARRHSRAQVILSGPGPAEEEVLRRAPELEGRLVIDRRAHNTFENAFYSLGLAQPGPQDRWLVVTSAVPAPVNGCIQCRWVQGRTLPSPKLGGAE